MRRRLTVDPRQFWQLIERSKAESEGDCDKQAGALTVLLLELPATAIAAFGRLFEQYADQAYRTDLWAAAYIIQGGCSDDGFEYFRSWLIGQGEGIYTAALRDPESLLSVVASHCEDARILRFEDARILRFEDAPFLRFECEELGYVADHAYEQKTGAVMPRSSRPMPELIGDRWDEEDLPVMFPKLWAAFE
jgi:hypothetical protein